MIKTHVNTYVSNLDEWTQEEIRSDLLEVFSYLHEEGMTDSEVNEVIEDAMNSRLSDLSDVLNIKKYL